MMRVLFTALLWLEIGFSASACRATPAPSQTAVDRARGVYVIVGPGQGNPQARQTAFSGPATGVYLRMGWSTLQPSADAFDWTALDEMMAAARRGNKHVSISVRAGQYTPAWLFGRVRSGEFTVGRRRGGAGVCSTIRIAVPWDRAYQAAYDRMMKALSAHLRATGAYDIVSIVKITGMNTQTDELRLPSAHPRERTVGDGKACEISDAPAIWKGLGYRPALAVDAWKALASSVNGAFPDKLLGIEIVGNDFPPIDQVGEIVARGAAGRTDVRRQIIGAGVRMFPGRFAVQRDGLNDRRMSGNIGQAKSDGAIIGMQSNLRRGPRGGGGAGCDLSRSAEGMHAAPCTPDAYRRMLTAAKAAGAVYVELWAVDVDRFGSTVEEAERAF